ncbi:peptide-methionine (S)-S-oxide reductase MsrA [Mycoplasmoides genitalium]|uniref:Peptide methionine sulfoxide reductase MsrA n=1 Tax=Mycoplasma genitalium (strain ATCC 33530 / DSM 19775 / NCTC 10195 / G37) TaxID=243273 RepID=MSRA_MYCGE|nr:peptide-methionine (S)-S-oxide reductase MsrA [Mycoplasmoides genitalium]P47648.1 RecName: Full=Peptide methionine sulfoxide reductase MsrA; Short=Protein-methionine-S-oxide reductase; AltName: Full=Peptide-methionine (S)-S-oxide reductase; Short=Peptide Met(O) reductase [Mycoplasmoides genitalium G37]AAC71636.1 methionine-S-sulfoxide reductase [Mycoplasmoides genitalium G37]AFQ03251.1 methionine sulfoxide reductase A [Mycoplasmoides genitalium M2321]
MKEIYFGGGCFWGIEKYFQLIKGVKKTSVGYLNSRIRNPSYEQVCSGYTNAVEAVKVEYEEKEISLSELIEALFEVIDPTIRNRQGNDIGTQYRTGIYWTDSSDEKIINDKFLKLQKNYSKPIVTENKKVENYYLAEEYHQDYLKKNPNGYCHIKFD